jgi:hypothetical protein
MKKTKPAFILTALLLAGILLFSVSCNKDEDENAAPIITSVTVNPAIVNAGATTTVTVAASDPDGDALTYTYLPTGGAISGSGASVTWTAPSQGGAYSVSVTVSDGKLTATQTGSLTVNQASLNGTVTGTAGLPAGSSGDLSNSKVSLYTTWDNWYYNQPIKFGAVTGAGANVTFTLTEVLAGNYYLDIWKDIDNSAGWSIGDFVGWYGSGGLGAPVLTEFQLAQGATFSCHVNMYLIAKGGNLPK